MKKFTTLLLITAILAATGCAEQSAYVPEMPESKKTYLLDSDTEEIFYTELYFLAEGNTLISEVREIKKPIGMTRAEAAIRELLFAGPSSSILVPYNEWWADISIQQVEVSGNVCLVYLGGEPEYQVEVLRVRAAVAATVQAAQGCLYTDVYVEDIQYGYSYRPIGALQPAGMAVDVLSTQYPPPEGDSSQANASIYETRDALLYFINRDEQLLVAEARTLQYSLADSIGDMLTLLFDELKEGPTSEWDRSSPIPGTLNYISSTYMVGPSIPHADTDGMPMPLDMDIVTNDNAEIPTTFTAIPSAYGSITLYFEGEYDIADEKMLAAALVNTATSFLPRIDGVRIMINNNLLCVSDLLGYTALRSDDATFFRTDFLDIVGATATLCVPTSDGTGVYPLPYPVSQDTFSDGAALLRTLFGLEPKIGLSFFTLHENDVLSVSKQGSRAVANFQAGFYDKLVEFMRLCELPREQSEKLVVFGIVNTLCSLSGIESVVMLENGEQIDKTLENIYLGNELYFNPGIMLRLPD